MKLKHIAVPLLAMSSFSALANEEVSQSPVSFSVFLGIATGGEKLASIRYDDDSSDSIKAGSGLALGGGLNYQINSDWSVQSNLAYFFDSDNADNADIAITRLTLDVIPYYQINDDFKVGTGITYHLNPEFEYDFTNDANYNINFDNALGLVASVGYELQSINSWLEIRYTALDYEASKVKVANFSMDAQGEKVDANHFALNFHYQF
jgi:outer membrane protein W